MVSGGSNRGYEQPTSELPEDKLRYDFRVGDLTWVKDSGSSWWPAQVFDEACVSSKPKKNSKHDCLVRLYGTCQYLYADPFKSNAEFKMMLKQKNKTASEIFHEVLEKELSCVNVSSGHDEEDGNSEGTETKVSTKKTSSRKGRKQEGLKKYSYKGVKKAATTESLEDESEDQDQELGSTVTTGVSAQKVKRGRGRKSISAQTTDKDSCDNSVESLRGKRQKQAAKESCKTGSSAVRREGLRRSVRANAKDYVDASEDGSGASEDATEDIEGTRAPHLEIKAMVRDILFKDILERERAAEMAHVDEVINGICNSTVDSVIGSATASMMGGQGMEQNGAGAGAESSNVRLGKGKGEPDQATEDTMQVRSPGTCTATNTNSKNGGANPLKEVVGTTPGRNSEATGST